MKFNFYYTLSALLFFFSCSKSDEPFIINSIKKNYTNGILFINEGNSELPNSSIGYVNFNYSNIQADIFNNNNRNLGESAQSIGFYNDKAFIVVSNSNKIEIVERDNFNSVGMITENINKPLYTASNNEKLYVTNKNSKSITIYNLKNYSFIKEIKLDTEIDKIVAQNNKLYVQQSTNGIGNKIVIIDGSSNEIIKTLEFQDNLQDIIANAGFVFVLSSIETRSNFYKINTENDEIITEMTSTKVRNAKKLRLDNNTLYYISENKVYSWQPIDQKINLTPLFSIFPEEGFASINAFDVINNQFLITTVKESNSPSKVQVYNFEGTIITTFETGINTSHFYKN